MHTSKRSEQFGTLFKAYRKRYPDKTGDFCQKEVTKIWKDAKNANKCEAEFDKCISALITNYEEHITKKST